MWGAALPITQGKGEGKNLFLKAAPKMLMPKADAVHKRDSANQAGPRGQLQAIKSFSLTKSGPSSTHTPQWGP